LYLHREEFEPQRLHSGQDSALPSCQCLETLVWFRFVLGSCHSHLQWGWLSGGQKPPAAHMCFTPSLCWGGQAFHAIAAVSCYGTPRSTQACFTLPRPLQWINGLTPDLCSDLTCSLIDGSTCFLAFCTTNTREGITIQKKQLLERRKEIQQVFYGQFPSFVPR